jgi:GIY-YIG catalytic domain
MEPASPLPADLLTHVERYALYRCYSDLGQLLYVGSTGNLGRRLGSHADKVWFQQVRGITLEWYATELDVLNAERRAIHVEHPKYNVQHRMSAAPQPPPRQVGKRPGSRSKVADRAQWPETKDISNAMLMRRVRAAAERYEREHDGKRLPALQLSAQLQVRMSRNTATALLAEHYGSPAGTARRARS